MCLYVSFCQEAQGHCLLYGVRCVPQYTEPSLGQQQMSPWETSPQTPQQLTAPVT